MATKKTGDKAAKLAGRIMKMWQEAKKDGATKKEVVWSDDGFTWGMIVDLAASVLSQTEPVKTKRKAR